MKCMYASCKREAVRVVMRSKDGNVVSGKCAECYERDRREPWGSVERVPTKERR